MFGFTIVKENYINELINNNNVLINSSDNQLSKLEAKIIDLNYLNKTLNEELNKKKDELSYKELLGEEIKPVSFSILSSANPELLNELFVLFKICQNTIALQSLKTRKIDGIAYRDGAIDSIEIIKAKLKEFYKTTNMIRQKERDQSQNDII